MSTADPQQVLSFRIGGMLFCVPVTQVEAIVEFPKLTTLPLLPDFALGVFQYRNEAAAVIDLGILLEVARENDNNKACLIISRIQRQPVGFVVDAVLDLLDTTQFAWTDVPAVHAGQQVKRALVRDQDIILLLDFEDMEELHRLMQEVKQGGRRAATEISSAAEPKQVEISPLQMEVADTSLNSEASGPHTPAAMTEEAATITMPVETTAEIAETAATPRDATELALDEAEYSELLDEVSEVESEEAAPLSVADLLDTATQIHSLLRTNTPPVVGASDERITEAQLGQAAARDMHSDYVLREEVQDENWVEESDDELESDLAASNVTTSNGQVIQTSHVRRPLITRMEAPEKARQRRMFALGLLVSVLVLGLLWWGIQYLEQKSQTATVAESTTKDVPVKVAAAGAESDTAEVLIIPKNSGPERLVVELPEHEMRVIRAESVTATQAMTPATADEITHVVVRGDTLWDIARKHLANPFRYPELARNSGIANPNLIYPGDVVKIRRRPNKDHTK